MIAGATTVSDPAWLDTAQEVIDTIEFAIGAVIADKRRVDRRQAGQVADVLVGEILERGIGGAVCAGTGADDDQGEEEYALFHGQTSAGNVLWNLSMAVR